MIRRAAVREYATGSLWVLPGAAALVALLAGFAVSSISTSAPAPRWRHWHSKAPRTTPAPC